MLVKKIFKFQSVHSQKNNDMSLEEEQASEELYLRLIEDEDSDSEIVLGTKRSLKQEGPSAAKKVKVNELEDNEDFIHFGFSDSEAEEDKSSADENSSGDDGANGPRVNRSFPWILDHDHSTQREIADWLSLEIKDFVNYISPSQEEIKLRNGCVKRLKEAIEGFWKDAHLYVFGSYATDLYLPHSDIDMVVKTDDEYSTNLKDTRSALYQLSNYLKTKGIITNVEVISKAKVPIIKFIEVKSKIHVDISFERSNGIEAAVVIKEWQTSTPGLRELVLITKQFLATRNLNNVHLGGLGGYSTICLVYVFLKLHPRLITKSMDPMANIGVLLIEFFELFGKNFGYDNVAVSPVCREANDLPAYLNKNDYPDLQGRNQFQLAIQDPSDPSNNISRGSFNVRGLKKAFSGAFDLLVDKCFELEGKRYKERLNETILGNIIKYHGEVRDFVDERDKLKNIALIDTQVLHYKRPELASEEISKYFFSDESSEDDTRVDDDAEQESEDDEDDEDEDDAEVEAEEQDKGNFPKNSIDNLMGLEEESNETPVVEAKEHEIKRPAFKKSKREYWSKKANNIDLDLAY